MTIGTTDREQVLAAVQAAVERYGASPDELIPILNEVNRSIGYLPPDALDEISRQMRVPKSQLFSVASFYQMLSTNPRGRHVVKFCDSAPCHVVGGRQIWQALQHKMGLKAGETSMDGKWTLVTTSCLGVCGVGPVVLIDDDIYGNVTPDQLDTILARYE